MLYDLLTVACYAVVFIANIYDIVFEKFESFRRARCFLYNGSVRANYFPIFDENYVLILLLSKFSAIVSQ